MEPREQLKNWLSIRAILFIIGLLYAPLICSQEKYFSKALDLPEVQGFAGIVITDSGYICTGEHIVGGLTRRFLAWVDPDIDTLHTVVHFSGSVHEHRGVNSRQLLTIGDFHYMVGRDSGPLYERPVLTKLTLTGDTVFNLVFDYGNHSNFYNGITTKDKDILLCGNVYDGFQTDVLLVKIDTTGDIVWDNQLGGVENDRATSIDTLVDGGFVIGVRSGTPVSYPQVIRVDSLGNLIWSYTDNGATGSSYVRYVTGSTFLHFGARSTGVGNQVEAYANLVDTSGAKIWEYSYLNDSQSLWGSEFTDVIINHDGDFVFVGDTYQAGRFHWLMQCITPDTTVLWTRIDHIDGRLSDHYVRDIELMPDGGYVAAGFAFPWSSFSQDGIVIRTNCLGYDTLPRADFDAYNMGGNLVRFENNSRYAEEYIWDFGDGWTYSHLSDPAIEESSELMVDHQYATPGNYSVTLYAIACQDTVSTTLQLNVSPTSTLQLSPVYNVKLYPNPAHDVVTVEVGLRNPNAELAIQLHTLDGRIVLNKQIDPVTQVDISDVQPGVYLVSLVIDGVTEKTEKLVKY